MPPNPVPVLHDFRPEGLFLPECGLWLDARRGCPAGFVSHAHSDHYARHARIVCSEPTAALLAARYRTAAGCLDPRPFFRPWEEGGFRLELLPAGHILGSAMLHATRMADGASLLYSGDFKLRAGLTAEAAAPRPADILVMESTFGVARYRFPPAEETWARARHWVTETMTTGNTPILMAYSLGKAQETLAAMAPLGLPAMAHQSMIDLDGAFRAHCPVELPALVPLEAEKSAGHLVIVPPNVRRSPLVASLPNPRFALLTGWALDSATLYRSKVQAAFPVSDHADFPELLEMVGRVRPRQVIVVHGFEREFASALRARGIEAWSACGNDQLELFSAAETDSARPGRGKRPRQ